MPARKEEDIEQQMRIEEISFKQFLDGRPKKKIFIPIDKSNPGDKVVPVAINGVTYSIPRGGEFEVPDLIYDVWIDSYNQTQKAEEKMTITEKRDLVVTG